MRLIKLSSNIASFKTVDFNPVGLTLIVGSKTVSEGGKAADAEKTYNGVGKSLLIELIHFCLGSTSKPAFKEAIPSWVFTLDFEISGVIYSVSRNTSKQNKVVLNNQEYSLAKFKKILEEKIFRIPADTGYLTFRALLSKFIRSGISSYITPDKTVSDYSDYDALIRNTFLLGIDTELVQEKNLLRKQYTETDNLIKSFEKDSVIRSFFKGDLDVDITLKDSFEEITRLEEEQLKFEVAGNYYDIQQEADELANKTFSLKNQIVLIRNAISSIDSSLRQRPDISRDRLLNLYAEVRAAFQPETIKHLSDVETFHNELLANRVARFSREKLKLLDELSQAEAQLAVDLSELDRLIGLLGNSRALDQFVTVSNRISELRAECQKLLDYKDLKQTYSDNLANIGTKLNNAIIKTNAYLVDCKSDIDEKLEPFRIFSKKIYPKAPAGITLKNNEGDNQIRFDLDIRIQNDSSDGVNEVRIFCFDMTLLLARFNHDVGFVFHDSRMYGHIDPRQRATLFRIADEVSRKHGFQYIATLNEDHIESMRSAFSEDEMKTIFTDNTKLFLKDDSPSSKLLGIQVDLKY